MIRITAAITAVVTMLVINGCGGGTASVSYPTVSPVPNHNWANPDGYRVYVQAKFFDDDVSHSLARGADGCILIDPAWRVDAFIIRELPDETVGAAGGIDGWVEVWNINLHRPETPTGKDWNQMPVGAYRFTGKIAGGGPAPFETIRVVEGKG